MSSLIVTVALDDAVLITILLLFRYINITINVSVDSSIVSLIICISAQVEFPTDISSVNESSTVKSKKSAGAKK